MSSVSTVLGGRPLLGRTTRRGVGLRAAYVLLGVLLLAYLGSLIARSPAEDSTLVDGWSLDVFEMFVCLLALAAAFRRGGDRALALTLGGAGMMWAVGDLVATVQSGPSSPSLPDIFYVAFFPLAYVALVRMVRRESSRLVPATWLDGAVAGLGVAALCATFAFHRIEHLAGDSAAAVATNLAYPIGDVLLLALAIGGTALLPGRRHAAWLLVAAGCALNAVGDTFNLFQLSSEPSHLGSIVDGIAWPGALLLMSAAVWVRPPRPDLLSYQPTPGFLLPALGACSALAVLLVGSLRQLDHVAVALAATTLVVAGVRLALSATSLRRLMDERHIQSRTDQLSGLGNRRRLADTLDGYFTALREPAAQTGTLAFLFVDLDHFKQVNDSFGHPAGDQLLRQIGPRIARCLGSSDLVTRIGGDEFAVVLCDADLERAVTAASRLSGALGEPFVLDLVSVQIATSIGIALAPEHGGDPDELLEHADQAMYRAKRTRTPFEVYDATLDTDTDRLRLLEELRIAIAERQFELHYQPQVELRSNGVPAVEALLRWPHPRLGYVPPLAFLPLAEQAGLMRELAAIVLDEALGQCAAWRADGHGVSVSVNVSATNIQDTEFPRLVRDRLARHGLPAEALVLEVTETTLISDFERCRRAIDELRKLGCTISIDDFGAGFTSLGYLSSLPVGELKLDRRFLAGMREDDASFTLVRATIELAHTLGLQVIAEGVEDQATLDALSEFGCDLAQGFHVGRPAPAADLALPARLAA
jgi:diguanylate cyclase (GGDEF)-like protein